MIYKATIADVPKIVPCASESAALMEGMTFNQNHYLEFWRKVISADIGALFLEEIDGVVVGVFGGIKAYDPLSGRLTAIEMCWYIDRTTLSAGISLYDLFKQWAIDQGCERITVMYLPIMAAGIEAFLQGQSLSLSGTQYEGSLT